MKGRVFSRFLDWSMSHMDGERASLLEGARGIVLEIGFGSGRNIPFYKDVEKLYAIDPSRELFDLARERVGAARFPVEYIQGSAEKVPLADSSVDAVVSTWTMCTIPDVATALSEAKRVLRPGGTLLFVEHGKSASRAIARIQSLLNPLWKKCAGGCNLDRDIEVLVRAAGFSRIEIEKSPRPGRPLAFEYRGAALR